MALFAISITCWVVLIFKIKQVKRAKQLCYAFDRALQKKQRSTVECHGRSEGGDTPVFAGISDGEAKNGRDLEQKSLFCRRQGTCLSDADRCGADRIVCTYDHFFGDEEDRKKYLCAADDCHARALHGAAGDGMGDLVAFSGMEAGASVTSNTEILGGRGGRVDEQLPVKFLDLHARTNRRSRLARRASGPHAA